MTLQYILFFTWVYISLATAKLEMEPWDDALNEIESELDPDSRLDFHDNVIPIIKNNTVDTERPYMKTRTSAKFTPDTEVIGYEGNTQLYIFQTLTQKYGIPSEAALDHLTKRSINLQSKQSSLCQEQNITCDPTNPYRSINGSCNNLQNINWGASFEPFDRIAPSAYEDFVQEPRGGYNGNYLPNPRRITTTIHYDVISPDFSITNMVPQVGQFLDHDMTLAPEADRHCCTTDQGAQDCWPIRIPERDPFYSQLKSPQTCMDFTRSTPYCFPGTTGAREQFNILTAFVDASQVYGSDDERAEQLREFSGGRLAVYSQNPNILPTVAEVEQKLRMRIAFMGKYLAGDERVNEMPALATLHTLLVREHNRIANQVEALRPQWSDEEMFQASRRILIAEWQNVIYGEYLPIILGNNTMNRYNLGVGNGHSVYDPTVNPTIFQAFATAAYRFGHTLINGIIQLYRGLQKMGSYELKNNFFESEQLDRNGGDGYNLILGGLMVQNSQAYDPHVTEALTNFVLKPRGSEFGADLLARNVQRAREHGVPSYSEYRRICNLTPLRSWSSRPQEILPDTWDRLRYLYQVPEHIDLFTGGLSEVPVRGAFSGATFNCLKAIQFQRTKFGDRFFYTHENQPGSFTSEQLQNIRSRTLGDIICDNSNLELATRNVFRIPSSSNPQVFCSDPTRTRLNFNLLLEN